MANVRITDLTELSAAPASGDELAVEDASANQTKKISVSNLFGYITGGVSALVTSNLTASRALVSGSGGKVEVSSVTSTELGYLTGLASNAQNQIDAIPNTPVTNLVYNGNFDLWDRGTSTTPSDDTYVLPGWNMIWTAASTGPTITQQTASPPDGSRYFTRVTAGSNQTLFMLIQFLEAQDAIPLRNREVSLSFQAKTGTSGSASGLIASWSSTADTLTSDIIATWTGDPPALAANWIWEATPAVQGLTTGWVTYSFENTSLDTASMTNIAVVVFGSIASGDTIDIAQVQCQLGANATTFVPRPVSLERQLAYRRFIRWAGDASGLGPAMAGYASAGSQVHKTWLPFPVAMRTTPTGTVGGTWALSNCTGPTLTNVGANGASITATSSAGGAFTVATNGTDDYLQFDAEL